MNDNGFWYITVQRFEPSFGEAWDKYVAWSGLRQLSEVVSLDIALCQPVLTASHFTEEDWQHNVHADFFCDFFLDFEYLHNRTSKDTKTQILAAIHEPTKEVCGMMPAKGFRFAGYDLIEEGGGISALTNCGGFPKAFRNEELNRLGLIDTFKRAKEVQETLPVQYPDEAHAECEIWALWRYEESL